ncbi:Uncharacterised protein [uncultured archaeon]|nr:Uncharacterised protein [uncultured archaeon]
MEAMKETVYKEMNPAIAVPIPAFYRRLGSVRDDELCIKAIELTGKAGSAVPGHSGSRARFTKDLEAEGVRLKVAVLTETAFSPPEVFILLYRYNAGKHDEIVKKYGETRSWYTHWYTHYDLISERCPGATGFLEWNPGLAEKFFEVVYAEMKKSNFKKAARK